TLLDVPSIAVSMTGLTEAPPVFDGAIDVTLRLARHVLDRGLPDHTLLNVNVPDAYDVTRGIRATRLGRRHYGREVEERRDPRGRRYLWIGGTKAVFIDTPGSDVNAAEEGVASVTPIVVDITMMSFLRELSTWDGVSSAT